MQKNLPYKVGLFSLVSILGILALAIPLRCLPKALVVCVGSYAVGTILGVGMALITRTKRPTLIYLLLLVCLATFVPLYHEFPSGNFVDIHPWKNAPLLVYHYFDLVRGASFILGIFYPFAKFGWHKPDLPEGE